jgi:hypothetical protein
MQQPTIIPTLSQLGEAIGLHLQARAIGLRELETETGISKSTLSRAMHGKDMRASHYLTLVRKIWGSPIFRIDEAN